MLRTHHDKIVISIGLEVWRLCYRARVPSKRVSGQPAYTELDLIVGTDPGPASSPHQHPDPGWRQRAAMQDRAVNEPSRSFTMPREGPY